MSNTSFTLHNLSFTERDICPICKSDKKFIHIPFNEIPIVKCKECDFMYSKRVMDSNDLEEYYKNNFGGNRHLQGQRINASVNLAALEKLIDFKNVNSYLDVGTGYGFLLKAINNKYNIHTTGVELSQQEAEYAINSLNLDVRPILLAKAELEKSSFDVVSCFEVIEHIAQPINFIQEIAEYVKPNGMMIVMTDNFTSPIVKKLRAEFPKWIPHTHISHFNPKTLIKCIESVPRLKVEKQLSYTPWELILLSLFMIGRSPKSPEKAYNLENSIKTEMNGKYKLFQLRLALNSIWANLTFQNNLEGALMFTLVRKI